MAIDIQFDAKTANRIRELERLKEQAVADENYDDAKKYKVKEAAWRLICQECDFTSSVFGILSSRSTE